VFHVKRDPLAEAAEQLDLRLTEGSRAALTEYAELLRDRAAPLGFIASGDAEGALERHVVDSLRAAPLVREGTFVVDLGSGAGLPGIPVAIARPDVTVTLLEAQRRRVAFLELTCDALGVGNAVPVHARVDEAVRQGIRAATCLARAFAPLRASWAAAVSLLEPRGRLVYFAGATRSLRVDAAGLEPVPVAVRTVPPPPVLASAGPLVIMSVL
jgi:16S rRNA (guanine527-N7)-methyltransferase